MQAPIVERLARRWRDRGVVAVGVSTDAPGQGDPRGFAMSRGLSYPIVDDGEGAASRTYGVEELPTLVVVSRSGKIVAVRTGVTDERELEGLIGEAL
jgi:peroxiredoxin